MWNCLLACWPVHARGCAGQFGNCQAPLCKAVQGMVTTSQAKQRSFDVKRQAAARCGTWRFAGPSYVMLGWRALPMATPTPHSFGPSKAHVSGQIYSKRCCRRLEAAHNRRRLSSTTDPAPPPFPSDPFITITTAEELMISEDPYLGEAPAEAPTFQPNMDALLEPLSPEATWSPEPSSPIPSMPSPASLSPGPSFPSADPDSISTLWDTVFPGLVDAAASVSDAWVSPLLEMTPCQLTNFLNVCKGVRLPALERSPCVAKLNAGATAKPFRRSSSSDERS